MANSWADQRNTKGARHSQNGKAYKASIKVADYEIKDQASFVEWCTTSAKYAVVTQDITCDGSSIGNNLIISLANLWARYIIASLFHTSLSLTSEYNLTILVSHIHLLPLYENVVIYYQHIL